MQGITWDIAVLAVLGVLVAYSIFIRKHKALATLVSVYVSYFVASAWGESVSRFFTGENVIFKNVWIQANLNPFIVQVGLLVIVTILLSTFIKLGGRRSRYNIPEIIAYAICTVALALMFILLFMGEEQRTAVLEGSRILPFIYQWREWVLGVPVVVMIYFGIYGDEDV